MTEVKNEISFRISGQNGDGIFSSGEVFSKICSRSGLHVHGYRSYQSVIRGGHVNYSVRAANWDVSAPADYIDVLIALRPDSFVVDAPMMSKTGIILYDSKGFRIKPDQVKAPEGVKIVDMPAVELASKFSKLKIVANTVFMGAVVALFDLEMAIFEKMLADNFASKGQEVIDMNVESARAGYNWAKENLEPIKHNVKIDPNAKPKMFIGGNEALAFGMLIGGLQFYAWYPMTPASPIGHFLAKYGETSGVVVKQMEDEINVSNSVVGAAVTGARSACATSGGGFSLMTEAVGYASMVEAPVVYIEVARGGPSTGLPTKQEQGDLRQLIGASQGDFPRAIIAQTSVEDGIKLGQEALNIAEKYQMPVIIASDLYMGEHFETIPEPELDAIPIDRGKLILGEVPEDQRPYKRYLVTEDGISPRTIPGVKYGQYDAGSDEHDEFGKLISDVRAGYPDSIKIRIDQMNKRMRKMETLLKELPPPEVEGYKPGEADVLLVTWGSLLDIVRESRKQLEERYGKKTAHLNIKYILPFHSKEVKEILESYQNSGARIILVENNYTGQMGQHIRAETGFEIKDKYLRYDGETILPREVTDAVMEILDR